MDDQVWLKEETCIITIGRENVIYSFKPEMKPVERVRPGETFRVITNDCFQDQIKSESQDYAAVDESKTNPARGTGGQGCGASYPGNSR